MKHENRIRALEAQVKSRDEENNITAEIKEPVTEPVAPINNRISQVNLAPDEV